MYAGTFGGRLSGKQQSERGSDFASRARGVERELAGRAGLAEAESGLWDAGWR